MMRTETSRRWWSNMGLTELLRDATALPLPIKLFDCSTSHTRPSWRWKRSKLDFLRSRLLGEKVTLESFLFWFAPDNRKSMSEVAWTRHRGKEVTRTGGGITQPIGQTLLAFSVSYARNAVIVKVLCLEAGLGDHKPHRRRKVSFERCDRRQSKDKGRIE